MRMIISNDNYMFVDVTDVCTKLLGAVELFAMVGDGEFVKVDTIEEINLSREFSMPIAIKGGQLPRLDVPFHDTKKKLIDGHWYVELSSLLNNFRMYN